MLQGVRPAALLDETLSPKDRDAIMDHALEELLQGCYATALDLPVYGGTATLHVQRGLKSDNPTCETIVSVEEQHESALMGVYRCDLRDLKLDESTEGGSAMRDAVLSNCKAVSDPLRRLSEQTTCATGPNSWFVCELGATCESYPLDDGGTSQLGTCVTATDEEAVTYAAVGPKASMVWARGAGDWPYALYTSLGRPTGDAGAWTSFWKTILEKAPPMYVIWADDDENSVTIFKGWSESPPAPDTALTDTLVALSPSDGEAAVMRCEHLPFQTVSWDEDGQPQDVLGYIAQVEDTCSSADDVYPFAGSVVCPADEAGPLFDCQNATDVCKSITGSWLGTCVPAQD